MDKQFALVLAGQVSAGLTRGDNELDRARGALTAIGLMVLNASDRDDLVQQTLALSDRAVATVSGDGTSVTYTPDGLTELVNDDDALDRLGSTTDAHVWAREFVGLFGGDEGLMVAWFANAIEAGRTAGERGPE